LGGNEEFNNVLNTIKDPFVSGIPKPAAIETKPNVEPSMPVGKIESKPAPMPVFVAPEVVTLPDLNLQGVMVGEEMHQAIINDRVVPLNGTIKGAKVVSVTKQGVELSYKRKKFFLKVD
jgi:hypothetical protein